MKLNLTTNSSKPNKITDFLTRTKNALVLLPNFIKPEIFRIYFFFVIVSSVLLFSGSKSALHLEMNKYHNLFFDFFFKYTTFLGDGVMFGVLILLFFFIDKRMSFVFVIGGILTLCITHLFKKVLFSGIPRPIELLGEESLYLIEGVKMAFWNSFPSGHTTTAFSIGTILCLYCKNCKTQYIWISLAIISGVSRVYLSQHFLIDIFVGSILGIFIGFASMSFSFKKYQIAC